MYAILRLSEKLVDNHIKDLSLFNFCFFLSQSTTFLSTDYVKGFLLSSKTAPASFLIAEKETGKIAALVLMYHKRNEYSDASLVLLISRNVRPDHERLAGLLKPIIKKRFEQHGLFCMRSALLAEEQDQIKIVEMLGFEKELTLKEQVYYDMEYKDACTYTLFMENV